MEIYIYIYIYIPVKKCYQRQLFEYRISKKTISSSLWYTRFYRKGKNIGKYKSLL